MANDTREDYSQYYPGGGGEGGGGGGSTPVMSDKVDRFTVPDIGLDPSFDEVAGAVRTIIRGVAPVATSLMLVLGAWGETARFGSLKSSSTVVVAEDDPVATAEIVPATNAAVETAAADAAAKVAAFAGVAATNYETKADAAAKLAAANAEIVAATNALAAKIPTVDLAPYAEKSWVEAQGFAKQSSLSGMASEVWVLGLGYVTAAITNGLASANWVQGYVNGRGFVTASVTNGLAGTDWVQNYVNGRGFVTKSITNGIEEAAVARAREGMASTDYVDKSIEDAVIAATGSNVAYRLMRENGSGFIDGNGRWWSITNMLGWTKWNNQGEPYVEEGWETSSDPMWEDGAWRYTITKTNPDTSMSDATWSCAGASNATELVMNYVSSTGDTPSYTGQLTLLLDYQKTNYVAKVTWDNELANATNATLQAAKAYTDAHSGTGGITTNDVCNIVTNEVEVFTEWTFEPQFLATQKISLHYYEYDDVWRPMLDGAPKGNKDSTVLAWGEEEWPGGIAFTARRLKLQRNAIGLVHQDTPTPQLKFAGGATNYVLIVEDGKLNLYAETPDEN